MEQIIDKIKFILVIGVLGYIVNWIIKLLLDQGCIVYGMVRDLDKVKLVQLLLDIVAQVLVGNLKLFKVDLLDLVSFDEVMVGCEVVMYIVLFFVVCGFKDVNEVLICLAVEGICYVLEVVC